MIGLNVARSPQENPLEANAVRMGEMRAGIPISGGPRKMRGSPISWAEGRMGNPTITGTYPLELNHDTAFTCSITGMDLSGDKATAFHVSFDGAVSGSKMYIYDTSPTIYVNDRACWFACTGLTADTSDITYVRSDGVTACAVDVLLIKPSPTVTTWTSGYATATGVLTLSLTGTDFTPGTRTPLACSITSRALTGTITTYSATKMTVQFQGVTATGLAATDTVSVIFSDGSNTAPNIMDWLA